MGGRVFITLRPRRRDSVGLKTNLSISRSVELIYDLKLGAGWGIRYGGKRNRKNVSQHSMMKKIWLLLCVVWMEQISDSIVADKVVKKIRGD